MTRPKTRVMWVLTGICLLIGGLAGLAIRFGHPDAVWMKKLSNLETIFDLLAVVFWMLIFAVSATWSGDKDDGGDKA